MRTLAAKLLSVAALGVGLVLGSVRGEGDGPVEKVHPAAGHHWPLLLSSAEPLLLKDEPDQSPDATQAGADNSRCHVCHLSFKLEELALVHARANIGCGECHGDCDAHIADESWASGGPGTPPGVMYPPERIDPACRQCHKTHNAPAVKVIQRWQERCGQKTDPAHLVCTDCHGHHRVNPKLRKAWWDKQTGKPVGPPVDLQQ